MSDPTRPDIEELLTAFTGRRDRAREWLGGMSRSQVNWQPEPGCWSIGQCLDHLCLVAFHWAEQVNPILFAALARDVSHREPYRPGLVGRLLVSLMETVRMPLSSPGLFRPRPAGEFEPRELVDDFDAAGDAWGAILRRASQVDIGRLWVGSPAAPLARMPVGTWLYSNSAHEARHLAQARAVTEAAGFPD